MNIYTYGNYSYAQHTQAENSTGAVAASSHNVTQKILSE